MSITMRTAKMDINPKYYHSEKTGKDNFSCDLVEPVNYPISFSPDGGTPIAQMQAVMKQCADNGEPVEISFVQSKDNWGKQSLTVYDVKPLKPTKATV